MPTLVSKNPATGEIVCEVEATPIGSLPDVFARARAAQTGWAALSPRRRAAMLLQLREILLDRTEDLIDLIVRENGKPRFEALSAEILPSVHLLTYFAKRAPKLLRDRKIPMSLMLHQRSYLHPSPLGVVAVISPWNYPFFIPFADVAMALFTGNAVVLKPSEAVPAIGLKIQELCEESGLPPHLVQIVVGDGTLGAALISAKPAKIFFTGSVETGKKVMAAAAQHLIPVNLELGGKDPMIVLPDADLDFASSAALWGAFSNAGQACASTERLIVHESIAKPFLEQLKRKIARLRQGPSVQLENDLGPVTFERQKEIYDRQLKEASEKGAEILCGGGYSPDRRYLSPTIVSGPGVEELSVYRDETFGPVVAATTYRSVAEAIQKANSSRYGLLASVITRNLGLGEQVAKQLEAGTVTVNEVLYTAALPETPWGGMKDSGFGRTRSDLGLYEFTHLKHIHRPVSRLFSFKSFWWYPYTPYQYNAFRTLLDMYRRHWLDKLRAFPLLLWNLVQFLKQERRL